jgi:hypothetical protein
VQRELGFSILVSKKEEYMLFRSNKLKGKENTLETLKKKIVAFTIALFFMLSLVASAALVSNVHAAAATVDIPTLAFINVAPNPCGIGQQVTVDFWLSVPLLDSERAVNMTVVETNPSGVSTTLGPFTSDITGGTTTYFTPTATGNYTFEFFYAGQYLTDGYSNYYEEPSHSVVTTLTVKTTMATGIPFTPLPTSYWQTPVNAENVQNWYALTGPWLGLAADFSASTGQYNVTSNYNPYTTGPTTSHILWTKPWCVGGVAGGQAGGTETSDFWTTSQYEPKWAPVVMDGMLYSTYYTTDTDYSNGIVAWNLYNGQYMWTINTSNPLLCGMQIVWESPNQYGVVGPYLITEGGIPSNPFADYNLYDALTGAYVCSIVNGPPSFLLPGGFGGGYNTVDSNGNFIAYYVNTTAGTETVHPEPGVSEVITTTGPTLCEWNMTEALGETNAPGSFAEWVISPGGSYQWDDGLVYAAQTIPTTLNGQPLGAVTMFGFSGLNFGGLNFGQMGSNVIVMTVGAGIGSVGETTGWLVEAGFNQNTGALLWGPYNRTETPYTRLSENGPQLSADGIYVNLNEATYVYTGYSLTTGSALYTKTLTANGATPNAYDSYGILDLVDPGTGVLYLWGLGGDIWAINMTNGDQIWWTDTAILSGPSGTETPYGIWPLWVQGTGQVACPGIIYLDEGHQYSPPLFHGAQYLAINMTNGQLVWKVLGFADTGAEVSYGILTLYNAYDGQIYAFGRGPSDTTVTAPDLGVTTATPVTITGTVTDVSPGSQQEAVAANFPNGLPCVSDASMSQFMEAVYEQQPMPTNITGVPVTLTETDHNGNTYTIGTTTSDSSGTFAYTWTPPIVGNYTIVATFGGSGGYYGSCAETHIYASAPAPTAAPTASPPTGLATTSTVEYGIVAVIIVIIIIGAVLALLMMRKHP